MLTHASLPSCHTATSLSSTLLAERRLSQTWLSVVAVSEGSVPKSYKWPNVDYFPKSDH